MVSQSEPAKHTGNGTDLAEERVLASGRPVLAVPYVGDYPKAGKLVLVAWNGTREVSAAAPQSSSLHPIGAAVGQSQPV